MVFFLERSPTDLPGTEFNLDLAPLTLSMRMSSLLTPLLLFSRQGLFSTLNCGTDTIFILARLNFLHAARSGTRGIFDLSWSQSRYILELNVRKPPKGTHLRQGLI